MNRDLIWGSPAKRDIIVGDIIFEGGSWYGDIIAIRDFDGI